MHRFRSWTLDPPEYRTQRNRLLPIEGGDGSTLNLDFTTGVLDPRLTFTRASDATFINSSGLVQWADANHVQNSTMLNNTGTRWTQTTSGGTVTINGDGTVRFNGTGGRATWLQSVGSLASGLPMTFSFRVTSFTNTNLRTTDLFNAGTGFIGQSYFYTDTTGTTHTLTAFESLPKSGTNGVGTYSVTATTTATLANIIFGSDCNGVGSRSGDVTITEPQLQYGTVVPRRVYVPNSSIIAAKWDSARFDHDPTTLAPRGLLVEGTATSLSRSSQDLTNATYWTLQTAYASTSATGGTAPDGTNTGNLFTEPSSNLQRSIYQSYSSAAGPYTFSVWLKAGSGSTRYMRLVVSSSAGDFGYVTINMSTGAVQQAATAVGTATNASATVSGNYTATGWRRYSLTVTLAASVNFAFLVPIDLASIDTPTTNYGRVSYLGDGSSFLIWGAQLEAGSGASSYIPTGASQVQRLADSCVMTGTNFSSWFAGATEGVLLAECHRPTKIPTPAADHAIVGTRYANGQGLWVYASATNQFPSSFIFPTGGGQFAGGIGTQIPLVSKQAVRWFDGNDITNFGNGTQGTTNTAGTGTMVPTMLTIGANSTTGTEATIEWFNGCIRRVKFWPTALPNATIQALTT